MCWKEEMREIDECDMEQCDTLDSSEKTIAILADRWWPQAAIQEVDMIGKKKLCTPWKQRSERPFV